MKISTLLDNIDLGAMALPEFQRGYVWNRQQVRDLMSSLYRRHPVGSLLVWVTRSAGAQARGTSDLQPGVVQLLLDGQQRITSLYGIVRGQPPSFFDGNSASFTGLHFNVDEETFEFHAPVKMNNDPLWVDVTDVLRDGPATKLGALGTALPQERMNVYMERLMRLHAIKDIDLHVEQVTGEDKTLDVVVDIFNRVNSGGTKLSKGDLALAKICASWPEARAEMKRRLARWSEVGFDFRLDWLLRNVNAIVAGRAEFSALANREPDDVRAGLDSAERAVDKLLNMIAGRLGLDEGSVLGSPSAFPLMARYLSDHQLRLDARDTDRLLYWYVHAFLWGRYAGSTETVLNQDLSLIAEEAGGLDRLIEHLRTTRGDLRVRPNDFVGWSRGARFYPLLYLLTRAYGARDWSTGLELRKHMLGAQATLEVHHVFPKALLYKHGYSRPEVNAVANFTFLTLETNRAVSDRPPELYIPAYDKKHPGAVSSHWIPTDPDLWTVERYRDFLAARRTLLAGAANDFLDGLLAGPPVTEVASSAFERTGRLVAPEDEEERLLRECAEWVEGRGLASPERNYELVEPNTGEQLAVLDLAWPAGLQPGLTDPVAVVLNEPPSTEEVAGRMGFRCFTHVATFYEHVDRNAFASHSDEPHYPAGVA